MVNIITTTLPSPQLMFYRFISNIKAHDGTTESPLPENVEHRGSNPIRIPRDMDYACRLVKNMLKR